MANIEVAYRSFYKVCFGCSALSLHPKYALLDLVAVEAIVEANSLSCSDV